MTPTGRPSRWSRRLRLAVDVTGLAVLAVAAALPAGLVAWTATLVAARFAALAAPAHATVQVTASTLALTGLVIVALIVLGTPPLWRRARRPGTFRLIGYAYVQGLAVGAGLLLPSTDPVNAAEAAGFVGGLGTLLWWVWQRIWRGTGPAPSPLTGVIRPPVLPGQLWYAYVRGAQSSKIRPVLVLSADADAGTWLVAYFTTRRPDAPHLAVQYLEVPGERVRGLGQRNWLRTTDLRRLRRGDFRFYVSLAPDVLYRAACTTARVPADPHAHTLTEQHAGGSPGPLESTLLSTLGLARTAGYEPLDLHTPSRFLLRLAARSRSVLFPHRQADTPATPPDGKDPR